jgi:hypothetical protein
VPTIIKFDFCYWQVTLESLVTYGQEEEAALAPYGKELGAYVPGSKSELRGKEQRCWRAFKSLGCIV